MRIVEVKLRQDYVEDWVIVKSATGQTYTLLGEQVKRMLVESDQMCEDCEDTGEVSVDEEDGEGHTMRGVGTQKCHCKEISKDHDE